MRSFRDFFGITYGQKVFLLATAPLVFAVAAISVLVAYQSKQLAEEEIRELETKLIFAKREELKNYLSIARSAFSPIYGRALPDDEQAKLEVTQVLSAMLYGRDGFFFVYDYDGTNLVAPRQTYLINQNWTGLTDPNGVSVVDELIGIAKSGAGYHSYEWEKPSTGDTGQMVTYVIGLQDWNWAIGTGVFIDDVVAGVAAARSSTEARVAKTFYWIGAITLAALLVVFASGLVINIRERRLADAKLKALTQRVLDTQEEERGRVARELHDSISQLLVGIRYALELARRRMTAGDARASDSIDKGIDGLNEAIQEVRRISRDLRPGQLDDLGLGPAIQSLSEEFSKRTGIKCELKTVVFRNRLDSEAKIALYRIAQEALMNIERHAQATRIDIDLFGHTNGATLRIQDDGVGMASTRQEGQTGLGLRNMQERIEQLNGNLRILSSETGSRIEATVPLSHLLPPETGDGTSRKASA